MRRFLGALLLASAVCAPAGAHVRPIGVGDAGPRLRALARAEGITLGRRHPRGSVSDAWRAFRRFAATPVRASGLASDDENEGLLFEYGAFDFGAPWGRTFEITFTRQLETRSGDLQQQSLTIHFATGAFPGAGPDPQLWSWDTGETSAIAQHSAWEHAVAGSRVFRRALAGKVKPLGFQIDWGSAE